MTPRVFIVTAQTAIGNHRDVQLARGLVEEFGRDGWLVDWVGLGESGWEARVICPRLPGPIVGRGLSRVSAISQAHVEAVRRLGLACEPTVRKVRVTENDRSVEAFEPEPDSGLTFWLESLLTP